MIEIPFGYNKKLKLNKVLISNKFGYSKLFGGFICAMIFTTPDITFMISILSRFISNLEIVHWNVLENLIRYLRVAGNFTVYYYVYPPILEKISDAYWCLDEGNKLSIDDFIFTLRLAVVAGKPKTHTCLYMSFVESILYALASTEEENEWIRDQFLDIQLRKLTIKFLSLFRDNQITNMIVNYKLFNSEIIQLRFKYAFSRYLTDQGVINLVEIQPIDNMIDNFTKGLNKD